MIRRSSLWTDLPEHHQLVVDRFVATCQADERVGAASVSSFYAKGTADTYSDLDFGLVLADEAYDTFIEFRGTFIGHLGEPVFLKDYHDCGADVIRFLLSDGIE